MKYNDLKRLESLSHLSQYTEKQLYTEVGLYQHILITTADVKIEEITDNEYSGKICVSNDVKALHSLCQSDERIMLPCPACMDNQPFDQSKAWNPRQAYERSVDPKNGLRNPISRSISTYGYSDMLIDAPPDTDGNPFSFTYTFGNNYLANVRSNKYNDNLWEKIKAKCGTICAKHILDCISEFRKEYTCTYNKEHIGFTDFMIFPAISGKKKLEGNLENQEDAEQLFSKYQNALILVKVGQYPSLKDLQFFDTKNYMKVLGSDYTNYTLALGLYADGVGAGSFVYLRRIIEDIVEEVHQECLNDNENFPEDKYIHLAFNEQIELLETEYNKTIIPPDLNDIRNKIYGMFSKGVHEYTEQECLRLFPTAKCIIEQFLDEKIYQQKKEEKLKEAKKQIANL